MDPAFLRGETRLASSIFGSGVAGGAELKKLYDERRWNELVKTIVAKRFVNDLFYYYFGQAAEDLGYPEAAKIYYALSIQRTIFGQSCSKGLDSCRGIMLPKAANERLRVLHTIPPRKVTFQFRLTDLEGRGIEGVVLTLSAPGATVSSLNCESDASGDCQITTQVLPSEEEIALTGVVSRADLFQEAISIRPIDAALLRQIQLARQEKQFRINDLRGFPVEGAVVLLLSSASECRTDSQGQCSIRMSTIAQDSSVFVTKHGMFPTTFPLSGKPTDVYTVSIVSALDYLCPDLKTGPSAKIASLLSEWAIGIWARAKLQGTTLAREGICTTQFKGRNYVSLDLRHDSVYNELKLNNYAIAVQMFDEVIRKVLDPIASAATQIPVDGYDISVGTSKRDFVTDGAKARSLSYRFYLQKTIVKKYKDKDITGQQLIDGSVVLLNDERIDLKLQ